jgi:dynein heavy chain
LIEEAPDVIEALLDPILDKQVVNYEGRKCIKVSEKMIDYNPNFILFITSKLPNPSLLPDVYIKTNVINFTVTFEGLDD